MTEILDGEEIVEARIRGESVRSIAKRFCCTLKEVKQVLDRFAEMTIDESTRKHTLALELARLDELQRVFGARALDGDVQSGALVAKIIERRCTMLGLYTPPAATLQVIEAQAPKESSTDRIERVLNQLCGKPADESESVKPDEPDKPDESDKLN